MYQLSIIKPKVSNSLSDRNCSCSNLSIYPNFITYSPALNKPTFCLPKVGFLTDVHCSCEVCAVECAGSFIHSSWVWPAPTAKCGDGREILFRRKRPKYCRHNYPGFSIVMHTQCMRVCVIHMCVRVYDGKDGSFSLWMDGHVGWKWAEKSFAIRKYEIYFLFITDNLMTLTREINVKKRIFFFTSIFEFIAGPFIEKHVAKDHYDRCEHRRYFTYIAVNRCGKWVKKIWAEMSKDNRGSAVKNDAGKKSKIIHSR